MTPASSGYKLTDMQAVLGRSQLECLDEFIARPRVSGYPEAERLWAQVLSLPCYPSLVDADVDRVTAALREALGA